MKVLELRVLGRVICALLLRELRTSARQSGSGSPVREPRQYEAPLCAEVDGDLWFPDRGGNLGHVLLAKQICNRCTHQDECAEWGIANERFGIWGGLSELDRRIARRRLNIVLPEEKSA